MNPEYSAYLRDCVLTHDVPMDYEGWLEMNALTETYHEPRGTQVTAKATVESSEDQLQPVTACA